MQKYKIRGDAISRIYKKSKKGVLVNMDDIIIRHYSNEDTFIITFEEKGGKTKIVLTEVWKYSLLFLPNQTVQMHYFLQLKRNIKIPVNGHFVENKHDHQKKNSMKLFYWRRQHGGIFNKLFKKASSQLLVILIRNE